MEIQQTKAPIEETPKRPGILDPQGNIPNLQPEINHFEKDTLEVETPETTQAQEVNFSRAFPSESSNGISDHLEKAVQEVAHVTTERQREREGVLEAEQKIRYKIIQQDEPVGPFKKGIPVVKPKRVIVRRKKFIRPARRIPKYLPTVDGKMWKVWGYPEVIELSTSSSEEVVEIPEGVELDQDGYPLLDPDKFDFTSLSPKWLRVLGKVMLYLMQTVTGFFMVKYGTKLWRSHTKEAERKYENRPPNLTESSSSSEDARGYRK